MGGKGWKEFLTLLEQSESAMSQYYGSLVAYMTPAAFHYYSPALLTVVLERNDIDSASDSFLGRLHFTCSADKPDVDRIIDMFSTQQKMLIAQVVERFTRMEAQSSYNPDANLRNYWRSWFEADRHSAEGKNGG